jgi:uncharacterized NAD(P)/FAD-binding protein YdhS
MTAVIVIGGGFTGAAVAVALSRQAQTPLDIAVIEPRAEVGRGVAFSATDRDHRINAPAANHVLTTDDVGGFHARPALEGDRNDLAGLRVVAKAGRVGQPASTGAA